MQRGITFVGALAVALLAAPASASKYDRDIAPASSGGKAAHRAARAPSAHGRGQGSGEVPIPPWLRSSARAKRR